ncbi:hypothetical protein VTK56DRAFT_9716 [Thermocarpiscus australiensis]
MVHPGLEQCYELTKVGKSFRHLQAEYDKVKQRALQRHAPDKPTDTPPQTADTGKPSNISHPRSDAAKQSVAAKKGDDEKLRRALAKEALAKARENFLRRERRLRETWRRVFPQPLNMPASWPGNSFAGHPPPSRPMLNLGQRSQGESSRGPAHPQKADDKPSQNQDRDPKSSPKVKTEPEPHRASHVATRSVPAFDRTPHNPRMESDRGPAPLRFESQTSLENRPDGTPRLSRPLPVQALAGPAEQSQKTQQGLDNGGVEQGQARIDELLRLVLEAKSMTDVQTTSCLDGLHTIMNRIEQILRGQQDMEVRFQEQKRWNQQLSATLEQQKQMLEATRTWLLDHLPSVVESIETDDVHAAEDWEEGDDSGDEYEDPSDSTYVPTHAPDEDDADQDEEAEDAEQERANVGSGIVKEEKEEEEYQLLTPEASDHSPPPTGQPRTGKKRKAKAQMTNPSPPKQRPPWVITETPVPNPYAAILSQEREREEARRRQQQQQQQRQQQRRQQQQQHQQGPRPASRHKCECESERGQRAQLRGDGTRSNPLIFVNE